MAKRSLRLTSAFLALVMSATTVIAASAAETETKTGFTKDVESSAEGLPSYYATNPTGVGTNKTISSAADWTSAELIAQGVANDDANVFRGPHEYPVYDDYALYGAWDDTNLYLGWQYVDVRDVTAPEQLGAGTMEAKPYNADMPQMLIFDLGTGNYSDGSMDTGAKDRVWGKDVSYETNVDAMMCFSSKPGVGNPALFTTNSSGQFSYKADYCHEFKTAGISLAYEDGLFAGNTKLMGISGNQHSGYKPEEVQSESSAWKDLASGHNAKLDTFYTITIPLASLGYTKADVESRGIGVMHVSIYGTSAIGCNPMDLTMLDNAAKPYGQDDSTTGEKDDMDTITVPLARIGSGTVNPPKPHSDTESVKPSDTASDTTSDVITSDTDLGTGVVDVTANAKKGDSVEVTLGVKGYSNLFGISNTFKYDTSKFKFAKAEALTDGVQFSDASGEVRWNASLGDGKGGMDVSNGKQLIKLVFTALADTNGKVGTNTVRDCYDYDFTSLNLDGITADTKVVAGSDDTESDVPTEDISITANAKKGDTVKVTFHADMTKIEGISNEFTYDTSKLTYKGYTASDGVQNASAADNGLILTVNPTDGKVKWNVINSGEVSGDKNIVTFEFTANKDVNGVVGADKVVDIYNFDYGTVDKNALKADVAVEPASVESDTSTEGSESDTEAAPTEEINIPVEAKAGDTVTVYFKVKNAKKALGIEEVVDFNGSALSYVEQAGGVGHIEVSTAYTDRIVWSSLFDAKGQDFTNETDVCVLKFKALKDISASSKVLSYKVVEFFDVDDKEISADNTSAKAVTDKTEVDTSEFKINVDAKKDDIVTVYFKVKNAESALGIRETVKYDSSAFTFVNKVRGVGHVDFNAATKGTLQWSSMFEAGGQSFANEKDIFVVNFKALKDITSAENVMSYIVDEFYNVAYVDFDPASTTNAVAITNGNDATDKSTDEETDTEITDNSDTESIADTDTSDPNSDITDTETHSDNTDTSEPHSDNSDTSDTHSDNSDTSDTHSDNSDTSDTHSDNSDTSDTHSDNSDTSDTHSDNSDTSDTHSDNSDTSDINSDDSDTETDEGEKVLLGDVNFDGKITARDSMLAQRGAIGLIKLSAKEKFVGDVDEDKNITTRDCLGILRYSINLNTNTATGQERIYKES
ncbi:MAG: dockerin type I domain-containing protein [Acutalibacteraceae bacterium]|nr:dockerin type I domain-containing protein [Acutalibacteraceae bacterium]